MTLEYTQSNISKYYQLYFCHGITCKGQRQIAQHVLIQTCASTVQVDFLSLPLLHCRFSCKMKSLCIQRNSRSKKVIRYFRKIIVNLLHNIYKISKIFGSIQLIAFLPSVAWHSLPAEVHKCLDIFSLGN